LVAVGYGTSTTSVGKAVAGVQSGVGDDRVGAGVAEGFALLTTVLLVLCALPVEPDGLFFLCRAADRNCLADGEGLAEAETSGEALGDEDLVAFGGSLAESGAELEPPPAEQPMPPSPSNTTAVTPTTRHRSLTNATCATSAIATTTAIERRARTRKPPTEKDQA
jgi:hypothetical protein